MEGNGTRFQIQVRAADREAAEMFTPRLLMKSFLELPGETPVRKRDFRFQQTGISFFNFTSGNLPDNLSSDDSFEAEHPLS